MTVCIYRLEGLAQVCVAMMTATHTRNDDCDDDCNPHYNDSLSRALPQRTLVKSRWECEGDCNTLLQQRTATAHCNNTLQQLIEPELNARESAKMTATPCSTLQHTITTHYNNSLSRVLPTNYSWYIICMWEYDDDCNTLQHTATHCNTLQHTATQHCHNSLSRAPGAAARTICDIYVWVRGWLQHCNTLQKQTATTHIVGYCCANRL